MKKTIFFLIISVFIIGTPIYSYYSYIIFLEADKEYMVFLDKEKNVISNFEEDKIAKKYGELNMTYGDYVDISNKLHGPEPIGYSSDVNSGPYVVKISWSKNSKGKNELTVLTENPANSEDIMDFFFIFKEDEEKKLAGSWFVGKHLLKDNYSVVYLKGHSLKITRSYTQKIPEYPKMITFYESVNYSGNMKNFNARKYREIKLKRFSTTKAFQFNPFLLMIKSLII